MIQRVGFQVVTCVLDFKFNIQNFKTNLVMWLLELFYTVITVQKGGQDTLQQEQWHW